jgi:serine/threonine protein kinase
MVNFKPYIDLTDDYEFFDTFDENANKVTVWKSKDSEAMIIVKKIDKHMTRCLTGGIPNDYMYPMKFKNCDYVIKPINVYCSESDYLITFPFNKNLVTLKKYMEKEEPSYSDIKLILVQVVNFVAQCFSLNVLHGDLRAANILLDLKRMKLYFIDFSESLPLKDQYDNISPSDIIELPEIENDRPFTFDGINVWSIGLILYGLLVGKTEIEPEEGIYDISLPSDVNMKFVELLFLTLRTDERERITCEVLQELINNL